MIHPDVLPESQSACYRRRFGVTDSAAVLTGLCYFDDAEADPMPRMRAWSGRAGGRPAFPALALGASFGM